MIAHPGARDQGTRHPGARHPGARDIVLATAVGALMGAQGVTASGAVAVTVVLAVMEASAVNSDSRYIASIFAYEMAGWWVGKTFFPPPPPLQEHA